MDRQQEDRARELARAAAGLRGGERQAFVARRAAEAPERVAAAGPRRALAGAAPSGFLRHPGMAVPEARVSVNDDDSGVFAGWDRFIVGELLGSGGMGTVFAAHDLRLKRTVALKFLRQTDDAATIGRFLREAEAQARVGHENVLGVYETGEHRWRPYIALQYVDGRPLLELREEIGVEAKARLLIGVADGLHAAHREGLVHRDVKPSNILVERTAGGRLKPYVMDFGLARPVESPELTATGMLLGTPHYMAPEQLSGAASLDRRTDVYGLGATMYQLFCGRVPFPGDCSVEVMTRALAGDPTPLRRHDPALPSEIEAIVMKCLEKEPERRYPSARAVAEDLRRFVDGEPVEARTSTLAYRLAKKMVRHKALVILGAVALALLVTVLAVFAVSIRAQARAIAREAERANSEAARGNREAERANREAAAARRVSDFMVELFRVSDPGVARGNTVTAREILDRGAERVEQELDGEPLVQAALMDTIGAVYMELGLYEPAAHMLEQGLEIARVELGDGHVEVAALMGELGGLYRRHGELERAEPLYDNALRILESSPRPGAGFAGTLHHLAALYADRGEFERAETLFRRALDLGEAALGPRDPEVAVGRVQLARLYTWQGDYERATDLYRRSLEALAAAYGADHPQLAGAELGFAAALLASGEPAAAAEHLARALAVFERVLPGGGELATVHTAFVELHLRAGELERGLGHGRRAVEEAARYAVANPSSLAGQWRLAAAWLARGEVLAAAGRFRASAEDYCQGLATIETVIRERGAVLGLDVHARLLLRLGRVEEARPLVENLLAKGWRHPPLLRLSRQAGLY